MDGGRPRPTAQAERHLPFLAIGPAVGARLQLLLPRFGGGNSYGSALIGWVEGEYLIVRRPLEGGLGVPVQAGESLVLRLFTGTDVAEFRSAVQRAFNSPVNYLHVDFPQQVRTWRLRSEPRHQIDLVATAEPAGQSRKVAVRVLDLSTGGARLQSPTPLGSRGQALTLTLLPAGAATDEVAAADAPAEAPAPLALAAQLRSVRPDSGDPQGSCVCGVQFENMSEAALAALRALIDARQQPAG